MSLQDYAGRKNMKFQEGFGRCLIPVLIILITFQGNDLFSQSWNLVKQKYGIKVYTKQEQNSSFKCFKGVADIKTNSNKVYAIIGNVRSTDHWDPGVRELKVLSSVKDQSFSYYLIYSIPWPLHDRDLCVTVKIIHDSLNGDIVIDARSKAQLVPEKPELVRIKNYWQKWIIHPIDKEHIRLTLEGFADPAGNIPAWLYNMVITDTPLNLIHDIQQKVK
jgi:hypothetical protein